MEHPARCPNGMRLQGGLETVNNLFRLTALASTLGAALPLHATSPAAPET
jgi:hypothetical protein